ncbi:MAG: NAD(P)-dependent alcohol dehydrogenase [Chloroflexi bacterium]|nr:NAD(P)-dependent alcohol dehydrogenase [Chloroflexota bacterium]
MQAIVYTEYGSPDVFRLVEVEQPVPQAGEVLVEIHAVATNAVDWRYLRCVPAFVRIDAGLRRPKNTILGADIAGRVAAVGSDVQQFQPGDAVFGEISMCGFGGFAEYAAVPESVLVKKPAKVSFEEAAAVPTVGFTALQGLRDFGKMQPGQTVLINGASGGVGTFAVQLAKAFGAEVTGVCSTRNLELVRSIGADHVIDYTQEDFSRSGQHYDLIFDVVADRPVSDFKRVLRPGGRCVVAGFTTTAHMVFQVVLHGAWISLTGSKKIGTMGSAKPNHDDLVFIAELLETGKVVPVIDRQYSLSETAEAIRYLEAGHARGKVIITVEQNSHT